MWEIFVLWFNFLLIEDCPARFWDLGGGLDGGLRGYQSIAIPQTWLLKSLITWHFGLSHFFTPSLYHDPK